MVVEGQLNTKSAGITTGDVFLRTLTELSDSAKLVAGVKHVREMRGSIPQ
jgi:hypothetical protein